MQKKQKKQKKEAASSNASSCGPDIPIKGRSAAWTVVEALDRKDARKSRFAEERKRPAIGGGRTYQRSDYYTDLGRGGGGDSFDSSSVVDIVGTCTDIEKPFFRLTAVGVLFFS